MKKKVCLFEQHLKQMKDPIRSKNITVEQYSSNKSSHKSPPHSDFYSLYGSPNKQLDLKQNSLSDSFNINHKFSKSHYPNHKNDNDSNGGSPQKLKINMNNISDFPMNSKLNNTCKSNKSSFSTSNSTNNKTANNLRLKYTNGSTSKFASISEYPETTKVKMNGGCHTHFNIKKLNDTKSNFSLRAFSRELVGNPKKTFSIGKERQKRQSCGDYRNFNKNCSHVNLNSNYQLNNSIISNRLNTSDYDKLNMSNLSVSPQKERRIRMSAIGGPKNRPSFNLNSKNNIKAEIDLLFGRKPQKIKEIPQEIIKEDININKKNHSSLLSKINKALKQPLNVFTKENLFEEVETEDFDNPKFREYMEDVILAEYLSTKPEVISNNNEQKKEKDTNLAESMIENSMYGNEYSLINKSTNNKTNSPKKQNTVGSSNNKNTIKKQATLNNNNNNYNSEISRSEITLFGIFDGHGGYEVSTKAKELLPKEIHSKITLSTNEQFIKTSLIECFEKTDKELMTKLTECDDMGSTCTVCFITKNRTNRILYCANLGDSHAYLVSNIKATRLTQEHKCDNESEVERLKEVNAMIFNNRLFGQLALTRAFCDRKMKPHGLLATPAVNSVVIKETAPKTSIYDKNESEIPVVNNNNQEHDLYLVIASDGIWDVTNDEDLMRIFVRENLGMEKSTKTLCKTLLDYAIENGSTDNISVVVVKL